MRGRSSDAARRVLAIAFTATALLCVFVPSAWAWSNGPQRGEGFGTHDWVLYQANRMATAQGYSWLDWSAAQPVTDDPDTRLRDTYHHVYDVWGDSYGDSPSRIAELYSQAVAELQAGNRAEASRTLGLLSHYYADTANPLHTDQTPAETLVHSSYEEAVDDRLGSPDARVETLQPYAVTPTDDARASAEAVAESAHRSYAALVSEYSRAGFDPAVERITDASLNAAVDGLADIIAGVGVAAGVPPPQAAAASQAAPAPPPTSTPGSPSASRLESPALVSSGSTSASVFATPPPSPATPAARSSVLKQALLGVALLLGVAIAVGVGVWLWARRR